MATIKTIRQSYDPEKAALYSNQSNKAEGQSHQEKNENDSTYDQQQQYYGDNAEETRNPPQQGDYDPAHEQDQPDQSFEGQEDHESHPSVASAIKMKDQKQENPRLVKVLQHNATGRPEVLDLSLLRALKV
ncbi:hypothetical protein VKS41_009247 [Umbelopsis sp. WA50703]